MDTGTIGMFKLQLKMAKVFLKSPKFAIFGTRSLGENHDVVVGLQRFAHLLYRLLKVLIDIHHDDVILVGQKFQHLVVNVLGLGVEEGLGGFGYALGRRQQKCRRSSLGGLVQ